MSDPVHAPISLIEEAQVIGYHRARPGRRVVAHAQVDGKPVCFIGVGVGTNREHWGQVSALAGFLQAAESGMVRDRNVQGPLQRETVGDFRERNGYELPVSQ